MIDSYWRKRPLDVLIRGRDIASEVVPYSAKIMSEYVTGSLWDAVEQESLAIELKEILTRLGPTFIKFGQILSIRPDLVPPAFIFELQKLCDSVPAFDTGLALGTIERELGRQVSDVYDGLGEETEPIAAASLGQVYKCTLKGTTTCVAVKVQRPDMIETVSLDLFLLRQYFHCVEGTKSVMHSLGLMNSPAGYDVAMFDAFAAASYLELDYVKEASNQELFRRELGRRMAGQVHVPPVFWEGTARRVLTSEWVEGEQLAKSSPETIRRLVPTGVACFLTQLLDLGYFHSDPHPGNLLVTPAGKLALIDFGLCAHVAQPDSDAITRALVHLMQGDVPALLQDAITLGFLHKDVDTERILPELSAVFAQGQAIATQMEAQGPQGRPQYSTQRRRKQFKAISNELNQIFFDHPFQVPEYFALITRALIVLEGIAVSGDPDFDLFQASYPFAMKRAVVLFGSENMSQIIGESAKRKFGIPAEHLSWLYPGILFNMLGSVWSFITSWARSLITKPVQVSSSQ
eukprot:CAMPEP_0196600754 /NCGR_PEP_ID=MMETSP1081-20130531/95554_1 /TAXON_ID=36882 /ORGANISM="Pyramimonas amylifera, Strain CCMP720" /LENGTH=517 /DNA_ID=CAMNT_0041926607 /DNA_START=363 /DNA_END=1916 /DNA_ORIENTATION=+